MNKSMTPGNTNADAADSDYWLACMSALVDGELSEWEFEALMAAMERDPELQLAWARYQAIGPLVQRAATALPPVLPANDAVFWRRLAVAASFVALSTVIWGLLEQDKPTSVLAQAPGPVWVSSAAGPMLRDAELEDLLQQHREVGDGGALQVSTGFLRSATLVTTP
jgi:anti-sigma factor RsiW